MNRRGLTRPLRKEGGFVLLITLLVVLLLVVIIFEIDYQSRADLRAAGNFRDDVDAYYVALSGITGEKAILQDDLRNNGQLDYLGEPWASTAPPFPIGEGEASGKITDEAGKFNLNSLLDANDKPIPFKKNQLDRLFRLLSVDPNLVDPIIDWVDKNDNAESNGAEDATYQVLPFPYHAKNGPLDTLEEILYIKGITQEVYQKIAPYLTVSTTDGKINVNTADLLILQSLHQDVDEPIAKRLMERIPYNSAQEFYDALPAGAKSSMNPSILFAVRSDIFSIVATGTVRNTTKTVHAIWNRAQKKYLYFKVE